MPLPESRAAGRRLRAVTAQLSASLVASEADEQFGPGCALVIGGSGLIGSEICKVFSEAGSPIAFSYRSNRKQAEVTASELKSPSWYAPLDIRDFPAVQAFVAEAKSKFGGIHSVVYASGPDIEVHYVGDFDAEQFKDVIMSDVVGYFNLVKATVPALKETKGSIVAISTCATERVAPKDACSAVPKAAVNMLTRHVAREYARFGIRANIIGTGMFKTDSQGRDFGLGVRMSERDKRLTDTSGLPMRRDGTTRELRDAVFFLASKKASYVTGQQLAVDGGFQL